MIDLWMKILPLKSDEHLGLPFPVKQREFFLHVEIHHQ